MSVISIADDINEYAHFLTIGLIAEIYYGEINLGNTEEHVAYEWVSLNELPENLCEPSKKIIDNYLNKTIYKDKSYIKK